MSDKAQTFSKLSHKLKVYSKHINVDQTHDNPHPEAARMISHVPKPPSE